jgi:hypothetical protein
MAGRRLVLAQILANRIQIVIETLRMFAAMAAHLFHNAEWSIRSARTRSLS